VHLGKYRQNSSLACCCFQAGGLVHRDDQNRKVRSPALQLSCCTEPVEYRHAKIEDHRIRVNPSRFAYCFQTVAGLKHRPTGVMLQKRLQFLTPERTVIGNKNAYRHDPRRNQEHSTTWRANGRLNLWAGAVHPANNVTTGAKNVAEKSSV